MLRGDRLQPWANVAAVPALIRSFGWRPRVSPDKAVLRAAQELHAAWLRGEQLTPVN